MEIEEERVGKEEIWGIRRRINGSNLWSELLQVMNMAVVAYLYFLFALYVFVSYLYFLFAVYVFVPDLYFLFAVYVFVAYLYFLFAVYVFVAYQHCLCFFVTNLDLICIVQNAVYDQVIKYIEISNLRSIDLHTFFHLKKNCGYAG